MVTKGHIEGKKSRDEVKSEDKKGEFADFPNILTKQL